MDIFVFADWIELGAPKLMGVLSATHLRGKEIFSFGYDSDWLQQKQFNLIDPDLQFFSGLQYPPQNRLNFGIFMDSAPDRWGRTMMDRREALLARLEDRQPKKFFESDYLLGVDDNFRMGALRFKAKQDGPFLQNNNILAAPPFNSIRELEQASLQLEEGTLKDTEAMRWLNLLLAPGASLGGARPKASVVDTSGQLWIAKFPSANDAVDIGAWEMVASELAVLCGINAATCRAAVFSNKHHSFLTKRFDRTTKGARYHFSSAMTLLGTVDGAVASYLDIRNFIIQSGAQPNEDLEELWKRIVFNIAIKNTDDHLRNHGFLMTAGGWKLSPAYDMNPNYRGNALTLNISETDNQLNFQLALSVAPLFRIKPNFAIEYLAQVKGVISQWSTIASKYKIPRNQQELMSGAFV
jgi:serine/threonine-protein kinase HipA